MATPITKGANHIGLTVSRLEESAAFFISMLGWKEVRRNDEYPAIFVSDGSIMLTLWATKEAPLTSFNRKSNVGLHHLALQVEDEASLHEIHERLKNSGTPIEFAPELVRTGPAKHMMCYEPSGIRVEFIWRGN
jgi:catechol 2,3-dioxygenase-like lactoylglutathione lyase family enzyme